MGFPYPQAGRCKKERVLCSTRIHLFSSVFRRPEELTVRQKEMSGSATLEE
jgi:hypothetical protein